MASSHLDGGKEDLNWRAFLGVGNHLTQVAISRGCELCTEKHLQPATDVAHASQPGSFAGGPTGPERGAALHSRQLLLTTRTSPQRSLMLSKDVTFFQLVNDELGI